MSRRPTYKPANDRYTRLVGPTEPIKVVALGIIGGILLGFIIEAFFTPIAETAQAETVVREYEVVMIEIETTEDYVIKRIKETFPEDSETAIKVARCESGLRVEIQSQHQLSYGQERSYGLFQVHAPDWQKVAEILGYENYKTDLEDNLALARYIYEDAGKRFTPWSCYTKKMI